MRSVLIVTLLLGVFVLAGCPPAGTYAWQDLMYGTVQSRSVYSGYVYVWFTDGGQVIVPLDNIVENKAALMPGGVYIVQYERTYKYYRFVQAAAENQVPEAKK